jgi:AcrR family transcriptional regulator
VTATVRRPAARRTSPPKSRVVLSRELIAETALRLTRDEPTTPLTLNRLGAELGADPTALYRHYRNRDELLLAVYDLVYGDVVARFRVEKDWRDSLRAAAWGMRAVLLERPALVAEVGFRFTGGPHEARAISLTREILEQAGLSAEQARQQTRAYGEMMLSHVAMSSASISAPDEVQTRELEISRGVYGLDVADMAAYETDTFTRIIDTYIDGLSAQARAAKRARGRAR